MHFKHNLFFIFLIFESVENDPVREVKCGIFHTEVKCGIFHTFFTGSLTAF